MVGGWSYCVVVGLFLVARGVAGDGAGEHMLSSITVYAHYDFLLYMKCK